MSSNQRILSFRSHLPAVILDLPQAKGSPEKSQQSASGSSSSTYDLRNTVSRKYVRQEIPYYKYLNTGKKSKHVDSVEDTIVNNDGEVVNEVEREIDNSDSLDIALLPRPLIDQPPLEPSSSHSPDPLSSNNLPAGPPIRSPFPKEWVFGKSNSTDNNLSRTYLLPIQPSRREIIKKNPSIRKCYSAPASPDNRNNSVSKCVGHTGRRSPLLGISALAGNNKPESTTSLEWDGLASTPSYYRRPTPIPIVSTPSTSFDSTPASHYMPISASPFDTPDLNLQNMPNTVAENLAQDVLTLQILKKDVENQILMFPPEHMTADRLSSYNNDLKEIKDKFRDFSAELLKFGMKYATVDQMPISSSNEPMTINWWQQQEQELSQKVNTHQLSIRQVASALTTTAGLSDFQKRDLELKEKQITLLEENNKRALDNEKIKANALAQCKYDEVIALGVELEDCLKVVEDWKSASRAQIVTAMKSLDKWALTYNNLNRAYREFSVAVATYPLPDISTQVETTMQNIIARYDEVTTAVRKEDTDRELYSLAGSVTELVKLPRFGGTPGEDFSTFKTKLTTALEKNRVPVSDKVEKLRSCLTGQALALVPEKTKNFTAALEVLCNAFGNPEKVLAVKIADLKKLGKCPQETINGKLNYQAIVSFCLKLEVLVQDLIDLAENDEEEQLKFDVYGSNVRSTIQSLFGLRDVMKMRALSGRGKVGLEEHVKYVKEFRIKAQSMVEPTESKDKSINRKNDSRSSNGDVSSKTSHSMFKNPRRNDNCRICGVLETQGDSGLYEDHISESIIGCPKFQAMTAEQRRNICIKAKFCIKCCDKEVIFNIQHARNCKVNKTQKFNITCVKFPKCTVHSWICTQHKDDNRGKISDLSRKLKINPPVNTNIAQCADSVIHLDLEHSGRISDHLDRNSDHSGKKSDHLGQNLTEIMSSESKSISNVSSNAVKPGEVAKVIKNMRRNAKKRGAEIFDIPDGNSTFVLVPLKGKTEPVLTFLDSGCSDAVFEDGIPGNQLPGICINEGPITCTGVGSIQLKARQEWIVKLELKDGNYQLVQGLTLDKVCAPMPIINTVQAVNELKKSDPNNEVLQKCCVPSMIGGEVKVILGIRYNNIGPRVIHRLESGLTIYSINLETHDSSHNAAIGGPHHSLTTMLLQNGGVAEVSHTLKILYAQLDTFKKYGPPRIPHITLSKQEMIIARDLFYEGYDFPDKSQIFSNELDAETDIFLDDSSTQKLQCLSCHNFFSDEDRLRDLKFWCKQMESGTRVEYRCPACRDCNKCRDSDFTDKVSIREEIEQKQVEDSIAFDRVNKKIWVSLPKRGDESFFLSSNREVALKVYQKMCEKASKDPSIKDEIIAAVEKLFKTGQALYLGDVEPSRLEKFIHKEVQHYLPWRVVYKPDSLSTSVRPVFDASSNTKRRPDGTGGRSLNDLLCKGRIKTMNLLRMVLRFCIGKYALCGDLQQFYCSCKLKPEEMNLTRFLYSPTLDTNSDPQECVFQALGFGLKSASAQSETVKEILADEIRDREPELALLLDASTYVDDMGESKPELESCIKLIATADRELGDVGLKCKQWTITGEKPSNIVSDDGLSLLVGGSEWCPELDSVAVRIPPLHFGKVRRGKLDKNTQFFKASGDTKADLASMDSFCPKLTRRICTSKAASIFNIRGLLAPILAGTKNLMRETVKCTEDWDSEISSMLRDKWLSEFLRLEGLRGIAFDRPIMPSNAVNSKIRLIALSDATKTNIILGVWGGFELPDGSYSCKLIIGRSILAKDTTIPKLELEGICSGANLGWIVRTALKGWDFDYLQASDSTIALCWVTSEQLRLNEFHRNRVVQIRRGVELNKIFHVKTDLLVADIGTRPEKVSIEDIMPGSRWHNGEKWMKITVAEAIGQGHIKPALELRVKDEEKDEFKDGIVFDKIPEVLTRGHALNQDRISKLEQRALFSQYVVVPTKFNFKTSFRITMLVIKFVSLCRPGKQFTGPKLSLPLERIPKIFTVDCSQNSDLFGQKTDLSGQIFENSSQKSNNSVQNLLGLDEMIQEESYLKLTATYFFCTATQEVKHFHKAEFLDKISVDNNGILYCKNRLLETMEFTNVSGMDMVNLDPLGVNTKCPILDRHSPLAYAFAQYIHHDVSSHSGMETCNRLALERFYIIQGPSLFRELAVECIKCKIKRRKFLEVSMGPVGNHTLNIAPPFYSCEADLFGPVTVYAPGASRDLRGRPAKACKVWVLVFTCPVSRLVNCQVVELSDHSGILDGLTRLAAEVGFPKFLMIDQDGAVMKGLRDAAVNLRNLQHQIYSESGVIFTTCPVGGHNFHGHVERVIRSIQNLLEDGGLKQQRLHATGLQTLLKLVENNYNSLPIG